MAIVVPSGITTPTMCKKNSPDGTSTKIAIGIIYTRTIASNGTISSAPASQQDLENITKTCFNNRVADIGQFLRDHLTVENIKVLRQATEQQAPVDTQTDQQVMDEFAANSEAAFKEILNEGDVG